MSAPSPLENVRIVLVRTSHPGNIGASARAMKTMGFSDLVLVAPRHFPDPDATAMAAGAADVLAGARIVETLEAALADCAVVAGFSARRRDLSPSHETLRAAAASLLVNAAEGPIALVFGNETSGLSNEELARCRLLISVPANPAYGSLNLAASVQVACYELATTAGAFEAPAPRERLAATGEDLEAFYAHLESAAIATGFLDPAQPGRFMERMRRLFARAAPERSEVKLLRGLLEAAEAAAPAGTSRTRSLRPSRKRS